MGAGGGVGRSSSSVFSMNAESRGPSVPFPVVPVGRGRAKPRHFLPSNPGLPPSSSVPEVGVEHFSEVEREVVVRRGERGML